MQVTLWGTRGSIATPGPETARYGGNTSCVLVEVDNEPPLVLDMGTGLRALGHHLNAAVIAPTFLIVGAISLVSTLFFLRLPKNAGAELHGVPRARPA